MPEHSVYVGRPTPFGNPFTVGRAPEGAWLRWRVWTCGRPGEEYDYFATKAEAAQRAVALYRDWLSGSPAYPNYFSIDTATYVRRWVTEHAQERLAGKDLACWCPLERPCHADVLLQLANNGAAPA